MMKAMTQKKNMKLLKVSKYGYSSRCSTEPLCVRQQKIVVPVFLKAFFRQGTLIGYTKLSTCISDLSMQYV